MSDGEPTAWERIQTRPIGDIVAEVFGEMGSRSDSDPLSPWADLALALCERVATAEARLRAVEALADEFHARASPAYALARRRVTKEKILDKCAADLRAVLKEGK